jgi:hypothetical protein
MNYEYNGKNLSAPIHSGLVIIAIEEAINFRHHPEAVTSGAPDDEWDPPDDMILEVGTRVKAKWHDGEYYPGIIARVIEKVIEKKDGYDQYDDRYDVNFDDGDKIKGLSIRELQPLASVPRSDPEEK